MKDYRLNIPDLRFILRPSFSSEKIIFLRKSIIPYNFVGKKVVIYSGRPHYPIFITSDRVHKTFGFFTFTKRTGSVIHVVKRSKKKLSKKKRLFF